MFEKIREKVEQGRRLSAVDGEFLFRPDVDLHAVGQLADLVRQRKNGDVVYYNINSHLNPTNICKLRCELCAYSCDASDMRGYLMSDDEIIARGREAMESGCTEMHIVSGLHPEMGFDWYLNIVRLLHNEFPQLFLKAWTAVEIDHFAKLANRSIREVLAAMIDAGLAGMPGGGAEIFEPSVREKICSRKIDARTWLDVHRTAHQMGLRTTATMLYGHLENVAHRVDHLVRLRELQDETGGFLTFIPLSFHPENTRLSHVKKTTGLDDLRTMAVSRLMLDNFDHVKAYWISLGVGTAQTALAYGADDLDGTVRHELIHHNAGSAAPEALSVDELCALIVEAGRKPVERDSLYQHHGIRPRMEYGLNTDKEREKEKKRKKGHHGKH